MSEIILPTRLTYSREFILKYSNHLKPEPTIIQKLQPYLSPPYTKQAKKHPLGSQRSPFGKKNFNNTEISDATSARFSGEKSKMAKTPNPRKADVLPAVQTQSEKKNFGRPKDVHTTTISPTQFRGKGPLNDSQKENVPASLNVNNTAKLVPIKSQKSPRAPTAKQDPLKVLVDNAVAVVSPIGRPSRVEIMPTQTVPHVSRSLPSRSWRSRRSCCQTVTLERS